MWAAIHGWEAGRQQGWTQTWHSLSTNKEKKGRKISSAFLCLPIYIRVSLFFSVSLSPLSRSRSLVPYAVSV